MTIRIDSLTGIMWWTGLLVLVGAFLLWGCSMPMVVAVKRENFKTCAQSGFCQRQRTYATNSKGGNWVATNFKETNGQLNFSLSKGEVELFTTLYAYTNGVIRLGVDEPSRNPARYRTPPNDVTIIDEGILKLSPIVLVSQTENDRIILKIKDDITINLQQSPFMVSFHRNDQLLIEINGEQMFNVESTNEPENETFQRWTDPQPYGRQSLGLDIGFGGVTHLLGIPEHATSLTLKPTRSVKSGTLGYTEPYRLYNLDVFEYELDSPMALYGSIPVMMGITAGKADGSAGIFWNNPSETWVDIFAPEDFTGRRLAHFISEAGVIDLFLLLGPTVSEVLGQYYTVTGRPQLPPLFSIGYHQCRWNYVDQIDLLDVNSHFDNEAIPADVLWLDIEHTEGKRYFTWDNTMFPNPMDMQRKLIGRQLVVIVDPHIKTDDNYEIYAQVKADKHLAVVESTGKLFTGDCWPGSSVWPDFSNQLTRMWWRKQFQLGEHPGYTEKTFIWNDMNEPSVFNGPETTMPKELKHLEGTVEHRNLHNLYGAYMHRATYEGLQTRANQERENPNEEQQIEQRPFVLTRAFYAGSQRYAAAWTGDNRADWNHLKASIPMLLSLGLSGMPFVGADVGGFFGDPSAELLTRWYQLGAFQPFFRAHAHIVTKRREPWLLPQPYRKIVREAIIQRYQLLPYIYTLFYESACGGKPINRPLFLEFPREKSLVELDDHFLLGDSLLIRPVAAEGTTELMVTLPQETIWYDYHGLKRVVVGKGPVKVPIGLDKIPIFARANRIIPRRDRLRRSSTMMQNDPYTLLILLDDNMEAQGSVYTDDGISHRYRQDQFIYSKIILAKGILSCSPAHPNLSTGIFSQVERLIIAGLRKAPKMIVRATKGGIPGKNETKLSFTFESEILTVKVSTATIALDDPSWMIKFIS